jgi:GH24 family phage-related lysozyme (muramidase)
VEDIQQAEESYTRLVKIPLEQHEADAVLSWIFNVGEEKIQHNGTNSLRLLNSGNREGFSDILLKWNKVRVNGELVESKGLTARRKKERAMFLGEVVHGG